MASLKRNEGYLLIDHRFSPGMPGLPEGSLFESATFTCRHCQARVIREALKPNDHEWCAGCNHYLCDRCAVVRRITGECQDIQRVFDKLQNEAVLLIGREPAELT